MDKDKPLLSLQNISKDFYGNIVLSDVSFDLKAGEIVGLVGENGAGKTTLMRILFGMNVIRETGGYRGKILIDGEEVHFQSPFDALDAGIGMAHQEFSLIPGFTTTENIVLNRESMHASVLNDVFGERMSRLDREDMKRRASATIAKLGVHLDPDTLVSEMPVGHKQFTEIAREINREKTRILVLDEPTAVLTESEAEVLIQALRNLAAQGIAIIFISHRLHEVIDVADRVVVLRDGIIVKDTPAAGVTVRDIAAWMVGRQMAVDRADEGVRSFREEILSVSHLWVDMPGETVRDMNFTVHKGEIFGIGGLAGQGKLGIPNGVMGLFPAGGEVQLHGKPVPLNEPRLALQMGMAFVSEDRRGVGLLLEESLEWNIAFTAMQIQERYLKKVLGGLFKIRDESAMRALTQGYIDILHI
jgi:simple sugar transport system ATP-binding protein